MIEHFGLTNKSRILDVGCGKAYLLYELKKLLPQLEISGFDISAFGLSKAKDSIREHLFIHSADQPFPFDANEFDLGISLGCLHNLALPGLEIALSELNRVTKQAYIMVESYRNIEELFNLQCWALTAETFFSQDEWKWVFDHFSYKGDYEFIYFE